MSKRNNWNKRSGKRDMKIGILFVLGIWICTGCSVKQEGNYTLEELDNLAEIRIYDAENDELIKTINEDEQLYQYNQCLPLADEVADEDTYMEERQREWKEELEDAKAQYYLTTYKYPVSRFGKKELEKNTTITLYEDKNIIKMTVSEESIKAFSLPEELLTFYYELSEEELDFYHSLLE